MKLCIKMTSLALEKMPTKFCEYEEGQPCITQDPAYPGLLREMLSLRHEPLIEIGEEHITLVSDSEANE